MSDRYDVFVQSKDDPNTRHIMIFASALPKRGDLIVWNGRWLRVRGIVWRQRNEASPFLDPYLSYEDRGEASEDYAPAA